MKLRNLLTGVVLGSMVFAGGVKAEEVGMGDNIYQIQVGEVVTPVYSVTIDWEKTVYNYVWDEYNENYTFNSTVCSRIPVENIDENIERTYYADSNCSNELANLVGKEPSDLVYYKQNLSDGSSHFRIIDRSQNGAVKAIFRYVPKSGYNWTIGAFGIGMHPCNKIENQQKITELIESGNYYLNSTCSGVPGIGIGAVGDDSTISYPDYYELDTSVGYSSILPEDYGQVKEAKFYYMSPQLDIREASMTFALGIDRNITHNAPVSGDVMGNVVINITSVD